MRPLFTIIICTYNRAELLGYCLESLSIQEPIEVMWELLVIDNNSSDDTAAVTESFLAKYPTITGRCISEPNQGLSYARNRGYREAHSDWILYLDDDAKAERRFLQRTVWLIEETNYRIVGGVYYPWYHYGKPQWWKDRYGSNARNETELCVPPSNYVATGGVMLWDRSLLDRLGGFDTRIGMVGHKLAYGEETYLQAKARSRNIAVAYDPKLVIYHVVMPQKLHVDYFFRAYFAAGRDAVIGGQIDRGLTAITQQLLLGFGVMVKDLLLYSPQLTKNNYYLENWAIDVFRKVAKRVGSVYTILAKKF